MTQEELQILRKLFQDVKEDHKDLCMIEIDCRNCYFGGESDAGWIANHTYTNGLHLEIDSCIEIKEEIAEITWKFCQANTTIRSMKFFIYKETIRIELSNYLTFVLQENGTYEERQNLDY